VPAKSSSGKKGQILSDQFTFDRFVKTKSENATIAIVLCKKKHEALVEITLPKDANIHGGRGPGLYPGVHFRRTRPWI